MTGILPSEHLTTPIEGTVYRDDDVIEAIVKEALYETGVIQRVKVKIVEKRLAVEVFAYSNKTRGGWRVDMELNRYDFTTRDTLEQMKAAVIESFKRSVRVTVEDWLQDFNPNFKKVLQLIVEDMK